MRTLTRFKMAATMSNKKSLDLALFMEEVQKYDCLYNKFSTEYRDKHKKNNCWKAIGKNSTWVLKKKKKKLKTQEQAMGDF